MNFYEVITDKNRAAIEASNLCFAEIILNSETEKAVLSEASKWELVKKTHYEYTNLAYKHTDIGDNTTCCEQNRIITHNGQYIGVIVEINETSSLGMSYHKSHGYGALFTNGSTAGNIEEHFSHCSTEVDKNYDSIHSLRKKSDA